MANKCKIGVLGPKYTYSDFAADRYSKECQKVYYPTIWEVFDALKRGEVEKGIVPIENTIHGTVRETFDALFVSDLKILIQVSLPIHHCIAVLKGTQKKDIVKFVSHQQALSKIQKYLRKNFTKAEQIGF